MMISLPVQVVHVWQASLLQSQDCIARLRQALSPDELERAGRFYFERDRRRFTVGRGALRAILAHYLGEEAKNLAFEYAGRGKPSLAADFRSTGLHFNLAHSHELALCAVVCDREVGVDLEHIHPVADMGQIAERFFSAAEYHALCQLPEEQQQTGFFHGWTRKEAYLKALGDGLSKPLNQFTVPLTPADTTGPLPMQSDDQETQRWCLWALRLDQAEYAAALVIANGPLNIRRIEMLHWQDHFT